MLLSDVLSRRLTHSPGRGGVGGHGSSHCPGALIPLSCASGWVSAQIPSICFRGMGISGEADTALPWLAGSLSMITSAPSSKPPISVLCLLLSHMLQAENNLRSEETGIILNLPVPVLRSQSSRVQMLVVGTWPSPPAGVVVSGYSVMDRPRLCLGIHELRVRQQSWHQVPRDLGLWSSDKRVSREMTGW